MEVLKFIGSAMLGGACVFCAMRWGWKQYDAGYRAGRADRRPLPPVENRRRG